MVCAGICDKPTFPASRLAALWRHRVLAGLTQIQVAMKLHRPQSFVSNCESGERRVDVVELQEFAGLYEKPITFFCRQRQEGSNAARNG